MKSARRSIATAVAAEPQTTGKTDRRSDADGEGVLELGGRRDVAFEEALEHRVVRDDDAFDEVVVHFVLERREVVRDLALGVRAALVEEAFVGQQVGDAAERGFLADRELERGDARAELATQLLEGALEAGPLTIELVHEDHPGERQVCGDLPDHLGLHLDAVDCADDEHGEVGHAERRLHVSDEVRVARGVDQVDLVAFPLERGQRERQAEAPLLLLGIEVGHRRALFHPPRPVDRPGPQQQGLGQRGLAGPGVADERHVADLGRRIGLQRTPSFSPSRSWLPGLPRADGSAA